MSEMVAHDDPPMECLEAGVSHDGKLQQVTFCQEHSGEAVVTQRPRSPSERNRNPHVISTLCQERQKSLAQLFPTSSADSASRVATSVQEEDERESLEMHSPFVQHLKEFLEARKHIDDDNNNNDKNKLNLLEMEIRLQNVTYKVPSMDDGSGKPQIQTIYNTSPLYKIQKCIRWFKQRMKNNTGPQEKKQYLTTNVLSNINLQFKPKCMYLILGPPLSGKTSLLKAIGGILPQGSFPSGYTEKKFLTGQILFNNLVCAGDGADASKSTLFKNLVAFIRQNDFHAPRLTVAETLLFSGRCKDRALRENKKGTSMDGKVGLTLEGLGLSHVQDTFVGNEQVRGVSGGQRRRVTLGEMLVFDTPLLCCDEISTGTCF